MENTIKRKLSELPIIQSDTEISTIFDEVTQTTFSIYFVTDDDEYGSKLDDGYDAEKLESILLVPTDGSNDQVIIDINQEVEIGEFGELIIRDEDGEAEHEFYFYAPQPLISLRK